MIKSSRWWRRRQQQQHFIYFIWARRVIDLVDLLIHCIKLKWKITLKTNTTWKICKMKYLWWFLCVLFSKQKWIEKILGDKLHMFHLFTRINIIKRVKSLLLWNDFHEKMTVNYSERFFSWLLNLLTPTVTLFLGIGLKLKVWRNNRWS